MKPKIKLDGKMVYSLRKIVLLNAVCFLFVLLSCKSATAADERADGAGDNPDAPAAPDISVVSGERAVTNGWADRAGNGSGLAYMNPGSVTVISDSAYPVPLEKRKAFTAAIAGKAVKLIFLQGDIDLSDALVSDADKTAYEEFAPNGSRVHGDIVFPVGSNTTLVGASAARIMFGGLKISGASNIIIRNVMFYDAHGSTEQDSAVYTGSKASIDALSVENGNDIWVDHCTFTDGTCSDMIRNVNHDGSLDIKKGKNITVSWCVFTNHDKVMLVGSDDTNYLVPSERQITLHHNYFHATTQRNPRSRGCQMHLYNNYYTDIGVPGNAGYCLGPGIGSQYIVENNSFGSRLGTIVKYFDKTASPAEGTFSWFYHSGNEPVLTDGECGYDSVNAVDSFDSHVSVTRPWEITYSYDLQETSGLNLSVPTGAGSGKKVSVNGGGAL